MNSPNFTIFFHYIYSMELVFHTKKELYNFVVECIEKDLKEKDLTTRNINIERYKISRRQFFHLKKLANNGGNDPDLSEKKLRAVIENLNKEIYIKYHIKW